MIQVSMFGTFICLVDCLLLRLGYDRSCLMKSICELARHPLHMRDNDDNVFEEMVHFVLT